MRLQVVRLKYYSRRVSAPVRRGAAVWELKMGLPAQCQKLLNDMNKLEAQVKQIQSAPGYIQDHTGPHPGRPDPESLTEVKALEKQIAAKNSAFNACLVANVAPFPVKITVTSIASIEGTSEIGSDEPYVIVTAVDLTSLVPGLECTLYGPVSMNAGESKSPGGKPFWFIDNTTGKAIPDLTKVIFVVSLMENDNGSPSAARAFVKGLATVSIAGSTALPLAQRITKLKADVDSAPRAIGRRCRTSCSTRSGTSPRPERHWRSRCSSAA